MWSELPRYPILLLFDVKLLCFYTTAGIEWKQLRGINNECASHMLREENLHLVREIMCPSLLSPVSSLCSRSQSRTYPADRGETRKQPLQRAVLSLYKVSITRHPKITGLQLVRNVSGRERHFSLNLRQGSLAPAHNPRGRADKRWSHFIWTKYNKYFHAIIYTTHRHLLFQVFDRVF